MQLMAIITSVLQIMFNITKIIWDLKWMFLSSINEFKDGIKADGIFV